MNSPLRPSFPSLNIQFSHRDVSRGRSAMDSVELGKSEKNRRRHQIFLSVDVSRPRRVHHSPKVMITNHLHRTDYLTG